jgi:hypothetical protein
MDEEERATSSSLGIGQLSCPLPWGASPDLDLVRSSTSLRYGRTVSGCLCHACVPPVIKSMHVSSGLPCLLRSCQPGVG